MKRGKKQIITAMISLVLVAMMVIQPFASFRSYAADTVKLTSLDYTNAKNAMNKANDWGDFKNGFVDCYDDKHTSNFLFFDATPGAEVSYNLNGKYKTYDLVCIVGKETGEGRFNIRFYGDGKELNDYCGNLNGDKRKERLKLNVKGVKTLTIKASKVSGTDGRYGYVFIYDNILTVDPDYKKEDDNSKTKEPEVPEHEDTVTATKKLTSLDYSSRNHVSLSKSVTTKQGKTYKKDNIWFDASLKDTYITYYLNKKYEKLQGTLVAPKEAEGGKFTVKFYGDGKLIKTYKDVTRSNAKNVSVDVKKVKKLKIVATNEGEYENGFVAFVNAKLGKSKLKLSATSLVLGIGEGKNITCKYNNKKVAASSLSWSSSSNKIAKVLNGKIVAKSGGVAIVKATYKKETKNIVVYVKPAKIQEFDYDTLSKDYAILTWKAQPNVSGYVIYEYDKDFNAYTPVEDSKGNKVTVKSTTIKLQGLTTKTQYSYKVCGFVTVDGKSYYGELSDPLTFTTR